MTLLSEKELEKYSRQILIEKVGIEGQEKIKTSSVLLIGCGGLGTSAAQYLVMAGVGKIKIIDFDSVELSNLNRQTLLLEEDIGLKKTEAIAKRLKRINSTSEVITQTKKIQKHNINKYLKPYKIILDCTDNFKTRYLINKYCHKNKKILISAALQSFDVQAFAFSSWKNKKNPCYECIFPDIGQKINNSCDQLGIIAPIAGLGGVIQATLTLNVILKNTKEIFQEFISLDCFSRNFRKIKVRKNPECKICNR